MNSKAVCSTQPSQTFPSRRFPLLISLLFLTSVAVRAGGAPPVDSASLPLAPGAKVIDLTPHPGFFDEPAIAVDPNDPKDLVAAYQTTAAAAYSRDEGQHWTVAEGIAPKDYRVSGDVSVTYDNRGRAFLCYIAFDQLGTENYWAHNATRNGIFVRRSPDGGRTWDTQDAAVLAHPSEPGIPFEDKPYIVADTTQGPYGGNLYVGWAQWSLTKSVILLSRSSNQGKTWSPPIEISTHEGLPRDDNGAVEGFDGAVGPDGTLYAVWSDGNEIVFTSSSDGGRTFLPSHKILDVAPPSFKVEDVSRANGFPQISIDPKTQRLYVTWSDYRNGDVDVFCATSADRGHAWSAPVRVNSDLPHNGADQFFQWLAVDPVDGSTNVIFYDRRGDPQNKEATVVLARSLDGGASFVNYAWTEQPFDAREDFLGDYTGIAAYTGRVYGIWTEERSAPNGTGPSAAKITNTSTSNTRHSTVVRIGIADFEAQRIKKE